MNPPVWRRWIPWTSVAALAALTAAAVSVGVSWAPGHTKQGSSPPEVIAPANGQGGYVAVGPLTQISAVWKVPTILPHSPVGGAVTWVGAQVGDSSFIQLGTVEANLTASGNLPFYRVFWSDIALDFHADLIGTVRPGDTVSANMTHTLSGWSLRFVDLTTHATHSVTTAYGRGAHYDLAEWIQEDPAAGLITDHDVPYPRTSTITMAFLEVDRRAPNPTTLMAQALITRGGTQFVPTPLKEDAFSLVPTKGFAKQYLADAEEIDDVESRFAVELAKWDSLSMEERAFDADVFSHAIGVFESQLAHQAWPSSTHTDIVFSEGVLNGQRTDMSKWIASGLSLNSRYLLKVVDNPQTRTATDNIRRDLGLPPR